MSRPRPLRRRVLALLAALWLPFAVAAAAPGPFLADFDAFWRALDEGYAYHDRDRAAWKRAREKLRPRAARATSREELLAVLESAASSLRDDAVTLSEASPGAPRRIPAESDLWAAWKDGHAVIEAVRTYGDADVAGLRPGHVVTRIDGRPVNDVVREALRGGTSSAAARDWALRHALAGPRGGTLRIEAAEGARRRTFEVERRALAASPNGAAVVGRRMGDERDLGYLRIRNGIADAQALAQFDAALHHLRDTRALMIDLRDLPGTWRREVTVHILARFAQREAPWQAREGRGTPRVIDTVAPRGEPYRAPVLVLVDRWTAGEAEALAAGLRALGARLVGTRMAGLRGEPRELRLPGSGIVVRYPAERAFAADGTPREALRPAVEIDLAAPSGGPGDPILYQALKLLEKPAR